MGAKFCSIFAIRENLNGHILVNLDARGLGVVSFERALKGEVDGAGLGLGLGLGVWAEVAGPNFLGFLMGL